MTSVERILQYTLLESEAPREIPEKKPEDDWPRMGAIEFRNACFAYYEGGPTILRDINLSVLPKEKVSAEGIGARIEASHLQNYTHRHTITDRSGRPDGCGQELVNFGVVPHG